ncbi:MAG: ABC transporter permease [Micropepsaceae bacterium]
MSTERFISYALPTVVAVAVLGFWEWAVWAFEMSKFVLPAPSQIALALYENSDSLAESAWVTVKITAMAFAFALVLGVALAVVFSQSRAIERALFPYAVTLQVTPIVAIAPLILIWVGLDNAERAVLILATVVAFFPILANTTLGLRSVDPLLHELFDLYGATRWQRLMRLQFPAAVPNILAGMKIAGGLALIGAVVAEFAAGSGTSTGLAWRIAEAGNRLETAKAFAALAILSGIGILIYALLSLFERQLLRKWHESAVSKE